MYIKIKCEIIQNVNNRVLFLMQCVLLAIMYSYAIAKRACTSGQFSESQLCPGNFTYCNDSGYDGLDNITYRCLCKSGYLVTGNISTQYFYSEICVTSQNATSTTAPGNASIKIEDANPEADTELPPILIALFCLDIALGLVAIAAVAVVIYLLHNMELPAHREPPLRPQSSPNTAELVRRLIDGEGSSVSSDSAAQDFTTSGLAAVTQSNQDPMSTPNSDEYTIELPQPIAIPGNITTPDSVSDATA